MGKFILYLLSKTTLPNLKKKICKQHRALQMQVHILRTATGMPIFVREGYCCSSCANMTEVAAG